MRRALVAILALGVAGGAAAVPALGGTTVRVLVKDDFFKPKSLAIAKGTTVRWVWRGDSLHNVSVAKGPKTFRSRNRRKGDYTHTFKRAGTYRIVCTIHAPDMRMTVRVK